MAGLSLGASLGSAQEARPHPEINKNNPQRQYLASRDAYLKKVATENPKGLDPKVAKMVEIDLARIPKEAIDAFEKYDEQQDWLAGVVHSQAYKDKARNKEGLSENEVERRKTSVLKDRIKLNDQFYPLAKEEDMGFFNQENGYITARFGKTSKAMEIRKGRKRYQDGNTAVHESGHSLTYGNNLLSDRAKTLYKNALRPYKSNDPSFNSFNTYISSPSELDARRLSFEFDLEKKGVWKYGEIFTQEHLKKALELDAAGELDSNSSEFLRFLEHKKIPEIINTIASNREMPSSAETKA